jgi:DNA-binding CsgD family transcriptional regulator
MLRMTARSGVTGPTLVGRDVELGDIGALIDGADGGLSAALLVSGEAGAGKTSLVQDACARVAGHATVLNGSCLPLASLSVPLLPLRSALQSAPDQSGIPPPDLTAHDDSTVVRFGEWLDALCADSLVVLTIDDLHWADQGTLDVLMYVLAGAANRRLAVFGTLRSEELSDDHPLTRWLADVRRLPRVHELRLRALDYFATEAQIASLLGGPPHRSLVDDVFAHTAGNPYLTRLVVAGLPENARHIGPSLPADLRSAVLQLWRRLTRPARQATQLLAIGGGPASADELDAVTGGSTSAALLAEAVRVGLLDATDDGRYWFHHPLTAEVLERGLTVDQRRAYHADFAALYEMRVTDAAAARLETLVAIADHHFHAAHPAKAYRWTLIAALRAAESGNSLDLIRLLRRAIALRDTLPGAEESRSDLLHSLRAAAFAAGAHEAELGAIEDLLAVMDPRAEPLLCAELTVRRMHLRFSTGRSFLAVDEARRAVELASADDQSWQYAFALAEYAAAGLWLNRPDAAAQAKRALRIARACEHPRALIYALCTNSMVAVMEERGVDGLALASEALGYAIESGDYFGFNASSIWESNSLETWASRRYAEHIRARREQLEALGAPHTYVAWLSATEASCWLGIGAWRECLPPLRVALGSDPGALADVTARLTGARLAALQGRSREAAAHLARADELFAETTTFLPFTFDAVRAEVLLAIGDASAAYDAAMVGATSEGLAPTMCEWLIPLAARALADQIQQARDEGSNATELLVRLDELVSKYPGVIRDFGESTELWERQIAALQSIYEAEVGRGRREPGNAAQWVHSVELCREAELAWEQSYSAWRAAESLLTHGHAHREEAASVLRSGASLAESLQATPVLKAMRELAATARIPLTRLPGPADRTRAAMSGLTTREREILDHVVAGRTYGEIARALTISEKTVSSHISNLLRKTGATNRVDLATRAMRHPPGQEPL